MPVLTNAQVFWYAVAWSLGAMTVTVVVGVFTIALKLFMGSGQRD